MANPPKPHPKALTKESVYADWEANNTRLANEVVPKIEKVLALKFGEQNKQWGTCTCQVDEEWAPCDAENEDRRSRVQVSFDPDIFVFDKEALVHGDYLTTTDWIDLVYSPLPEESSEALVAQITTDLGAIEIKAMGAIKESAKALDTLAGVGPGTPPPPVPEAHAKNLQTLIDAAKNGDLAVMSCTDAKSGAPVYAICAVYRDKEQQFNMVPLAKFFDGDPYEELIPPIS